MRRGFSARGWRSTSTGTVLPAGDDFARDAVCKSWGCHSGEMYSQWWKSEFGVPMIGAIGKTDFAHGGLPMLSDASTGKWAQ